MDPAARIAFLGGGNMARAMIQGLLRHGLDARQLCVGEPDPAARATLQRELAVSALADNLAAIGGARLVVLAVKPQHAAAVLRELGPGLLCEGATLLSIAAGLRIADLAACCPGLPIVRAMPNRAALVGAGATALYAPESVPAAQRALAGQVCAASGRAVWVPRESDLDIVTALSGSGPAYFFLLGEQLAAAASAMGLDQDTAELLARQTLCGAGALAGGATTLATERAAVTSKGGTTAAALNALAQGGFEPLVAAALAAAVQRSRELARQFGAATADASQD